MTARLLLLLSLLCMAFAGRAGVALVPSWLPEEQRFEVEGTSNEVAHVERTLAFMRDSFHPKLRAMMAQDDLGPTLQWVVHISQPGAATNEAAYFNSYAAPLAASAFGDFALLTNRAARLSYLPPAVRMSLVFDDGRKDSLSRAIPGVDYPGVAAEDDGSTPHALRLTLRAPGRRRDFKVRLQAWPRRFREVEYKWIISPELVQVWPWEGKPDKDKLVKHVRIRSFQNTMRAKKSVRVFFFAREKGSSVWGVPSIAHISPDDFGQHAYDQKTWAINYIDYGDFRDIYTIDGENRIMGFTRVLPGMALGKRYANAGELVVETYPSDRPKVTRSVKYSVKNGKLAYEVSGDDVHHKNEPRTVRHYCD